ncbi:MAG: NAD(P)-dependent oxidoreductase [Bdellovibrionales bacterium]|nr:NAD(P)-dependent oxidoreductase [Bdellovibrionales bacterium]
MSESEPIFFITGGDGGIGSYLPKDFVRLSTPLESPLQKKVDELKSKKPKQKVKKIFIHLAAMASVTECEQNPDLAYQVNVGGSEQWFQASQSLGFDQFLLASTAHVYAPPLDGRPLTTGSPIAPQNQYAKTKRQAEVHLQNLERLGQTQLKIARIFSVLSEKGAPWALLQGLRRRAQEKDFSPIPGLSNQRDFLWAPQVAEQLILYAQTPTAPALINICSGKPHSVREIAEIVFKKAGEDANKLTELPIENNVAKIIGQPYFETSDPLSLF